MVNFMKNMQYHFVVSLLSLAGLSFGKTIAGQRCWYALGASNTAL
jgi:hypothetical protein